MNEFPSKSLKTMVAVGLAAVLVASPALVLGADQKPKAAAKPYPLKTCVVTGEKLDKDAFVWVYKGQEIKMCCEGCKDDFLKDPAKFLKKIEAAKK